MTRTCSIDGCDKPTDARGWCAMHYGRWRRNGTTDLEEDGEETLCTCIVPLDPTAFDECMRCRRPVYALLAERYGWVKELAA